MYWPKYKGISSPDQKEKKKKKGKFDKANFKVANSSSSKITQKFSHFSCPFSSPHKKAHMKNAFLGVQIHKTRGVSHCGLAIHIKKYVKAKEEELWKLKYFTMQK